MGMTLLQKLIIEKTKEGKTLRGIASESGVEYTSIYNYFHRPIQNVGAKNLKLMSQYFEIPFYDLLEEAEGYQHSEELAPMQIIESQLSKLSLQELMNLINMAMERMEVKKEQP